MTEVSGIRAGDIPHAAQVLLDTESSATARDPITDAWPDLDLRSAYAIQDEALHLRKRRGERLIGIKLGLTSRAKQRRMGVSSPLLAWLTDAMVLPTGEALPRSELIHPRAEPEIIFVMRERLSGPGVTSVSAMSAVGAVYGGIEIIDSRYRDFKFTLPDVVSDNASAARFMLGSVGREPTKLDLAHEAVLLEHNGLIEDTATGAAVQGNPAEALAYAANDLAERGMAIEPGWLVLTGGMTDAIPVPAGSRVAAHFSNLGSVTVSGG